VFHPELGSKILDNIADQVASVGKVETQARLDGRNMTMVLAPDRKKAQKREQSAEPAVVPAPTSPNGAEATSA
jgi:translation initiation factor IF-3